MTNPGVSAEQYREAEKAFADTKTSSAPDGCITAAAKSLDLPRQTFANRLRRGRELHAEGRGSFDGGTDDGWAIKGRSTLYGPDGEIKSEWVKTTADMVRQMEMIREGIAAFIDGAPKVNPGRGPSKFDKDVIPWFQIGDAHLGMLAYEAETGANFDMKIAERELCAAFAALFDECPPHERCVINDLGDATHYENMAAVTEASGHSLDADGRFPKMIRVYSKVMRFIVERALERFKYVDVLVNQGNHSRTNDIWMAELLRSVYGDKGRVNVMDNSSVFIPYRMGNTFVLVHHSDKTKAARLPSVMANDYRQDWGETEYHYIDVGHLHHKMTAKESEGCTVEQWNTLAPKDQWATNAGFRSHQSITRVDRSKTYGEVGRRTLPIGEVRAILGKSHGDHYTPPSRPRVFTV